VKTKEKEPPAKGKGGKSDTKAKGTKRKGDDKADTSSKKTKKK